MPSHAESRFVPYTPAQMFELVADIEKYPDFLPWCVGARIRKRAGTVMVADLLIGFRMVREKFTSRVVLQEPERIDVVHVHGPLEHLTNSWRFHPAEGGSTVDFRNEFEFRSRILRGLIGALFHEAAQRMVAAFEGRAHTLYGEAP